MAITLRPYQAEAKEAILQEWSEGRKRTLLVLPTGCGKTVVLAKVAEDQVEHGGRVLIMAHRGELLDQAADKVREISQGSLRIASLEGNVDRGGVMCGQVAGLIHDIPPVADRIVKFCKEWEELLKKQDETSETVSEPLNEKKGPLVVKVRRGYSKYALDIGGIKTDPYGGVTFISKTHEKQEEKEASSLKFFKLKKEKPTPLEERKEPSEKVFRIKKAK